MKRKIMIVLFLGTFHGNLKAAKAKVERFLESITSIKSPEYTIPEMDTKRTRCPYLDPKPTVLGVTKAYDDDDDIDFDKEVDSYIEKEIKFAEKKFSAFIPRVTYKDDNKIMLLTFFPPNDRARRYAIKLKKGAFSTENFTVDMTRQATRCNFKVEPDIKKKLIDPSILFNEKQAILYAKNKKLDLLRKRALQIYDKKIKKAHLYGTSFWIEGDAKIVFFCCRSVIDNKKTVPFIIELANIDDIDTWLVDSDLGAVEGVADQFIESIAVEYL